MQLLCRNLVKDFDKWYEVFQSHAVSHEISGIEALKIWTNMDNPNDVFFLFKVHDRSKAEAFMNSPEAEEAGRIAGVIEGECFFVEEK